MIYVVTGHPRSGTSAVMEALEAGGIPIARSPRRDKFAASHGDENYRVNPRGLYELTEHDLRAPDHPVRLEGLAVKLIFQWIPYMFPHWERVSCGRETHFRPAYRVVLILRHPEEIRQSFASAMETQQGPIGETAATAWWRNYGRNVRAIGKYLRSRCDVASLHVVSYGRLLRDPGRFFLELAAVGWPLDAMAAAAAIRPGERRFTRSALTAGI